MKLSGTGVNKNSPVRSEICVRKPAATTQTTGIRTATAAMIRAAWEPAVRVPTKRGLLM